MRLIQSSINDLERVAKERGFKEVKAEFDRWVEYPNVKHDHYRVTHDHYRVTADGQTFSGDFWGIQNQLASFSKGGERIPPRAPLQWHLLLNLTYAEQIEKEREWANKRLAEMEPYKAAEALRPYVTREIEACNDLLAFCDRVSPK